MVFYDVYSTIIGQSSNIVRSGEQIEITAGVGAFSRIASLKITIAGKEVTAGDEGIALYKFKSSSKPGTHFIPVKLSYTDQDGKEQTIEKNVEYTVAEECDQIKKEEKDN
ncbi:MAG: hypothetical protein WDO16_21235 [Bacteroidota bacterium]